MKKFIIFVLVIFNVTVFSCMNNNIHEDNNQKITIVPSVTTENLFETSATVKELSDVSFPQPIDFTIKISINSDMQEFEFKLEGIIAQEYGRETTKIYKLTISNEDGSFRQEFSDLSTDTVVSENDMYGLSFDDWNFDGYLDVSLWKYIGGSMGNNPHYYWLWDNDAGLFTTNTELEEISDTAYIAVDAEKKQVKSSTNFGFGEYLICYYEYINGKYIMVKTEEVLNEPSKDRENKYIVHIIIKELIDGELLIIEDYYES